MINDFKKLQDEIKYKFKDNKLLELAFTHSSYINENNMSKIEDNQRLEFLGDAVLELITSYYLYNEFKDKEEGFLTKKRSSLVCEETLSKVAIELKLYNYLKLGNSESIDKVKNNQSIMCDTFESLLGAMYLDGGFRVASEFIHTYLLTHENLSIQINNYKSILQEYLNARHKSIKYIVVDEKGPDHNKEFYINVYVDDELVGSGMGHSKKEAEQNAAKATIYKIMV